MYLNKVILTGYVGDTPQIRYIRPNYPTAVFPLATVESGYTLSNGQQRPEQTDWHRIVLYGELALKAEKYVKKGSVLLIEGKLHYRQYADKAGLRHHITEIIADKMEFFDAQPFRQRASDPERKEEKKV